MHQPTNHHIPQHHSKKLKKLQRDHQKQPPTLEKKSSFYGTHAAVRAPTTLNPQVSDKIYYLYKNTNNYGRVTYKEWSID